MQIIHDADLSTLNTFGLVARAERLVELESLVEAQAYLAGLGGPFAGTVLGGGSNVLLAQEHIAGDVVRLAIPGIETLRETEMYAYVRAGAGVVWHDLVTHTVRAGLGGLENLALIWGWVGAAPMQNIGAYGVEVKDVIYEVETIELATGERRVFSKDQCRFGYRESYFKQEGRGRFWITSVTFRLLREPIVNTGYGAIQQVLDGQGNFHPTAADVMEAVIQIRQSKLPDPRQAGNAGSFFKNPEISKADYDRIFGADPLVPNYPAPGGQIKVPAGYLIERAGWKGHREGPVGVHPAQALVLVNYGGATGAQLLALAHRIQADVEAKFSIRLSMEVNVVN